MESLEDCRVSRSAWLRETRGARLPPVSGIESGCSSTGSREALWSGVRGVSGKGKVPGWVVVRGDSEMGGRPKWRLADLEGCGDSGTWTTDLCPFRKPLTREGGNFERASGGETRRRKQNCFRCARMKPSLRGVRLFLLLIIFSWVSLLSALEATMQHTPIPDIPGVLLQHEETRRHLNQHISGLCGLSNGRFPGSQPVSFSSASLEMLETMDYWVCEKSDGVRVLVFIVVHKATNQQEVWLVN